MACLIVSVFKKKLSVKYEIVFGCGVVVGEDGVLSPSDEILNHAIKFLFPYMNVWWYFPYFEKKNTTNKSSKILISTMLCN